MFNLAKSFNLSLKVNRKPSGIRVSNEVLTEVLSYMSRKTLCKSAQLVNEQFFRIANNHIPCLYLIPMITIEYGQATSNFRRFKKTVRSTVHRYKPAFNKFKLIADTAETIERNFRVVRRQCRLIKRRIKNSHSSQQLGHMWQRHFPKKKKPVQQTKLNICIQLNDEILPEKNFLKRISIPTPHFRLQHVIIRCFLSENLLDYCDTMKTCFTDCSLDFYFPESYDETSEQVEKLLGSAFNKCFSISFAGYYSPRQVLQIEGVLNCNKLDLDFDKDHFEEPEESDISDLIINWLYFKEETDVRRHLILEYCHISDVPAFFEKIKKIFLLSKQACSFVVTLKMDHLELFELSNEQTGEQLRLFIEPHSHRPVYRLWRGNAKLGDKLIATDEDAHFYNFKFCFNII